MFNKYRLPFLLLGLGIGIILTNTLYTLNPQWEYREYTDDEIIERAKELGMVFLKDSIDIKPADDEDKQDNSEIALEIENEEDVEEKPEIYEEIEEITFVIEVGDSLTKVSKGLEKAGLIDDAESFLEYGIEKGVDKRLRVGVYKLTKGLDYDTIISILLKQEDMNKNSTK